MKFSELTTDTKPQIHENQRTPSRLYIYIYIYIYKQQRMTTNIQQATACNHIVFELWNSKDEGNILKSTTENEKFFTHREIRIRTIFVFLIRNHAIKRVGQINC